jgi:hypothetical protein
MTEQQQPVHLPSNILRKQEAPPAAPRRQPERPPQFAVARRTNNELILFDEPNAESWIIYPPRSEYDFLALRRRSAASTIVEHHPWSAALTPVDHVVDPREGCLQHGLHCPAQLAITTAVQVGYDPFK